jgi:hypothetical protein
MNEIKTILSRLDQGAILCELPESEFETGGAINEACRAAGYWDSGRVTINDLNLWGATVADFAAICQINQNQDQ